MVSLPVCRALPACARSRKRFFHMRARRGGAALNFFVWRRIFVPRIAGARHDAYFAAEPCGVARANRHFMRCCADNGIRAG